MCATIACNSLYLNAAWNITIIILKMALNTIKSMIQSINQSTNPYNEYYALLFDDLWASSVEWDQAAQNVHFLLWSTFLGIEVFFRKKYTKFGFSLWLSFHFLRRSRISPCSAVEENMSFGGRHRSRSDCTECAVWSWSIPSTYLVKPLNWDIYRVTADCVFSYVFLRVVLRLYSWTSI